MVIERKNERCSTKGPHTLTDPSSYFSLTRSSHEKPPPAGAHTKNPLSLLPTSPARAHKGMKSMKTKLRLRVHGFHPISPFSLTRTEPTWSPRTDPPTRHDTHAHATHTRTATATATATHTPSPPTSTIAADSTRREATRQEETRTPCTYSRARTCLRALRHVGHNDAALAGGEGGGGGWGGWGGCAMRERRGGRSEHRAQW